ncbi:unnamed protein product, partial [marine sediment metagenome]
DEFRKFIEKYGVAKTEFEIPKDNNDEFKILIESNDVTSGFEFQKKLFFIPGHFVNVSNNALFTMAEELTEAIFNYIAKRKLDTPSLQLSYPSIRYSFFPPDVLFLDCIIV